MNEHFFKNSDAMPDKLTLKSFLFVVLYSLKVETSSPDFHPTLDRGESCEHQKYPLLAVICSSSSISAPGTLAKKKIFLNI
jgi:hypothetical protein